MIDYARISRILEYSTKGLWPHAGWPGSPVWKPIVRRLRNGVRVLGGIDPLRLESHHPLEGSTRNWEYPWVFERVERLKKQARILDCGCGSSRFPWHLASKGYEVTGLDYFEDNPSRSHSAEFKLSEMVNSNYKVNYQDGGIENIPFPDSTFDAVLCISVMEHIVIEHRNDPEFHFRCLDEMKRVLKPGGLLVCTYDTILNAAVVFAGEVWGSNGWWYLDDIDYTGMTLLDPHAKRYSREDILSDDDTFFVPPERYLTRGYGNGFANFGAYHRLTSVGFALVK